MPSAGAPARRRPRLITVLSPRSSPSPRSSRSLSPKAWRARALLATGAVMVLVACSSSSGEGADPLPSSRASSNGDPVATIPPATTPPTTKAPRRFTIAASGDILLHNLLIVEGRQNAARQGNPQGYDFNPMFDEVRATITAADLAICHQETPISADNTDLTKPKIKVFNSPREIATALKGAGFDACDTASNHTWDKGLSGVRETIDVLEAAGLGNAGSARTPEEAAEPPIYDANGVQVGHLAYSYTITNSGSPTTYVPPEAPWLRSMLWPVVGVEGIIADARAQRARGAEFVVVSMHWGNEYSHQPNEQQRQMARELLTSPEVDLIIGDHVHVVQPCEKIGDKYVIYGMGNFLSNQSPQQDSSLKPGTQDGTLNTFTVDETSPGRFATTNMTYVPTYVTIPGHAVNPATPDRFKPSYDRTVGNVSLLGPGVCDAVPAF